MSEPTYGAMKIARRKIRELESLNSFKLGDQSWQIISAMVAEIEAYSATEYHPDVVTPPGQTILETIEAKGMTRADLANRMGCSTILVNGIIAGNREITPEIAAELERILGVSASFWLRLEANYRKGL